MSSLDEIPGIGPATSGALAALGIENAETLAAADPATLIQVRGISAARAARLIEAAQALAPQNRAETTVVAVVAAPEVELAPAQKVSAKASGKKKAAADKAEKKADALKKKKKAEAAKKKDAAKKKADKKKTDKKKADKKKADKLKAEKLKAGKKKAEAAKSKAKNAKKKKKPAK